MAIQMKKFAKYMPMSGFPAKKGQALQVSISEWKKDGKEDLPPTVSLFVEFAPQVKDKPASGSSESPFDWSKKIFISLKEEEVGLILATLRGRTQGGQIIHKFPIEAPEDSQKTSTLNIKAGEYNGETNYQISLRQKQGLGESVSYAIYLQPGEAEILVVILEECIRKMYRVV